MDGIVLLDIGSRLPLGELWGTAVGFVIMFTVVVMAIGMSSRSLTVGSFGGYLAFMYFGIETNLAVLKPIVYTSIVLVITGAVMKMWRLEGFESGS